MNWLTWLLILSGVGLNAAAQLLLKTATRSLAPLGPFGAQTLPQYLLVLARNPPFWAGMTCYGLSVCVWIAALTKAPVSTAYPMLSLGYVVVTLAAVAWLGETLDAAKIVGIGLICAGVFLVSRNGA
ncbi:MAG: EamA family transporter [Proteobacteria bacterium]|nr:EamA family transporter [Pseudomonadota bacterium]